MNSIYLKKKKKDTTNIKQLIILDYTLLLISLVISMLSSSY